MRRVGGARRFGGKVLVAALLAAAIPLACPVAAQETPATIAQMRARDVFAAPAGELAAWQAFAAQVAADPAASADLQAEVHLGLATAMLYARQHEAGWAEWQRASAIAATLPQAPPFTARMQAYGSLLLTELGRVDEAVPLADAALASAEARGSDGLIDQALAWNAHGMIAFARNDLLAAETALCRARDLGLAAPVPDHAMVVNDASSCAAVKYYLERPDTLAAMRLASDHAHAHLPPDHPKMGNVLNSAYAVLLRYGRYAEAEPLIRRHLELERSLRGGEDADEVYDPLSQLGRALELRGANGDAEQVFRAAADMADRLHSATQPWVRGHARSNLATVIARQGRLADAEAEARGGVERLVADLAPDNSNIGSGRVRWADMLDRLGRREQALAQVEQGLALLEADHEASHSEVLGARAIRARVLAGLGRTGEAMDLSRAVTDAFAAQMADLAASETDRVALTRVAPLAFADHVEVALAAGDMAQAVRGGQLLLAADLGVVSAHIAAASAAREQGLGAAVDRLDTARAAVATQEAALARAQAEGSDAAAIAPLLATARAEAEAAQAALLAAFPRYADLARPQVPALADLQARLAEGQALVLPLALPARAVTLLVTRDAVSVGETPLRADEVAALADRVRTSAQSVGSYDVAAARALYDVVFPRAIRRDLAQAHSLLFPASGYLARLSPAVLLAGPADPQRLGRAPWLVRTHGVRVVADLAGLGEHNPPLAARAFVGVGAPAAVPAVAQGLGDLPLAAGELQALGQAIAAPAATVLTGSAATEARLAATDFSGVGVIAFATHGLVGGDVAGLDEPALVLNPEGAGDPANDGLLTASEIARLHLNADWVILSACNTAAGESAGAPGYSGLARSFARAGARSLLLSHWRLRDDAAAALTVATLRAAASGAERGEALRQAQLALMARADMRDAAHPAVWAGFVIVEN